MARIAAAHLFVIAATGVKIKHESQSCECLAWQSVYQEGKANCGEAAELFSKDENSPTFYPRGTTLPVNETSGAHEDDAFGPLCHPVPGHKHSAWFMQLPGNYCVKENKKWNETTISKTWCYVPATCTKLNGGRSINADVNMKICQSKAEGGADALFADETPEKLDTLVRLLKLDAQQTFVMTYPWQTAVGADYKGPRILNFLNGNHYVMDDSNASETVYWEVRETEAKRLESWPPVPPTPAPGSLGLGSPEVMAAAGNFIKGMVESAMRSAHNKTAAAAPKKNPFLSLLFR